MWTTQEAFEVSSRKRSCRGTDAIAAKRKRLSGLGCTAHRRLLLDDLIPVLIAHPSERLTLISLARSSGITLWTLRGAFGNVRTLLADATSRAFDVVVEELEYETASRGVMNTVRSYAAFLAKLLGGVSYRRLMLIIVRNSISVPWGEQAYRDRIVLKVCRDLEKAVRHAGAIDGNAVLMRPGAARRLFKRIEAEVALPFLMPEATALTSEEIEKVLERIAQEAFAATYLFEWASSSAEQLGGCSRPNRTLVGSVGAVSLRIAGPPGKQSADPRKRHERTRPSQCD